MGGDDLLTSATRRFLKLGGAVGRAGASVAAERLLGVMRGADSRAEHRRQNLVENVTLVVETLGKLKGATMKLGQMLSLHQGLLPPEVAEVLRSLQKEAPQVPSEVMEYEI